MTLKIGDKVRNIHDNSEGYVTYSAFGLSVNGFTYLDDGQLCHFKLTGKPRIEVEKEWKRVYKFKYDMKQYEDSIE